ncbi:MAG TPA: methyltransferase domain-containing protein [Sediminibacterium sp.]|nr:methyltransferase domain-containing protein [Sediminibacterium sp.]
MYPSGIIKKAFARLGLQALQAEVQFRYQRLRNRRPNNRFRQQHPSLAIPPDRDLFETFQLHYEKYFSDGKLAAAEIMHWYAAYRHTNHPSILDWGCGTGRVIQHIHVIAPEAVCHGCDSNNSRITWAGRHISHVRFSRAAGIPLPYATNQFDLVYGISVLTHIDAAEQLQYIKELYRVLQPGGILILSTHGSNFTRQLSDRELEQYLRGAYTTAYSQKGHRLICTYNHAFHFQQALSTYFNLREYYDGKSHPNKLGGQDLWIVQKAFTNH